MKKEDNEKVAELIKWISELENVGLSQEEVEGCLEFYQDEWEDVWTMNNVN